jgi:tetratricopeptide (TPR) repeat protein
VLVGLLYALTLAGVFTFGVSSLTEFDFWWYLASAEVIRAKGAVLATDPFSYTAEGRPWINHMWASQLGVLALWNGPGRVALLVVKGLIVTATFAVVLVAMRRRSVNPLMAAAATLLAAWAGWDYWDVRPQVVTYLLLAVFLLVLRDGWERRPRALLALPLLMVPWVNLHAGFLTGIGVVGLVGAGTALPLLLDRERRGEGVRVLALAAGVAAATVVASLANPYGPRAILFPLEVVNTRVFMTSTTEWFSPNFHNPAYRGFEVMLLLLVPALAWGRTRLRSTDIVVMITFTHLALTSARHVPLFAVAVAPPLADALEAAIRELWARRAVARDLAQRVRAQVPSLWPVVSAAETPLAVAAFVIVVGLASAWGSFLDPAHNPFFQDLNERRHPHDATDFIKRERLPAPLFNTYAWGGYELWRLYPEYRVFIDGRTHVYGREVLQDFLEVTTLGPRWRAVLDKWNVQTLLAERHSQLTQVLLAVGGWRPVFAEREAVVFLREAAPSAALLARLPAVAVTQPIPDVWRPLAAALAAAQAGNEEGAIRHYQEALRLVPDHPVALLSLGILREQRGELPEARALFQRMVDLYPEGDMVQAARKRLEKLP